MPANTAANSGPGASSANPAGNPSRCTSIPITLERTYDEISVGDLEVVLQILSADG